MFTNTLNGTRSRLHMQASLLLLNCWLMSLANPQVPVGYDVITLKVILDVLFQLLSTELVCTGILRVKHVFMTKIYFLLFI